MNDREAQIRDAEGNLALLRGNVVGVLQGVDLTAGGTIAPTTVEPEFDGEGNLTGSAIITRSGVRYRVSVDYA